MRYAESLPGSRSQRILAVALLALVIVTIIALPARLSRTYQSGSSVVLLASRAASRPFGGNPYLSFTPSLTLTAELVSQEIASPTVARHLGALGVTGAHTVTLASYGTSTTGSVLLITVTGASEAGVEHSLRVLTRQIGVILNGLQAGEKPYDKIHAATLSMQSVPSVSRGAAIRSLGIAVALELAAGFAVIRALAALTGRRRDLELAARSGAGHRPADSMVPSQRAVDVQPSLRAAPCRPASRDAAPMQPSSRNVSPVSIENDSASKV